MTSPANPARRILVVDDEPLVCDSVKRMLLVHGYEVETAVSGAAALALLDRATFDLVIIDYLMPVMKGDELAGIIQTRSPGQRIMMISASPELLQTPGHPVNPVVGKPFEFEELGAAVARVLSQANPAG